MHEIACKAVHNRKYLGRFLRFLAIGAVNTVFGFLVYWAMSAAGAKVVVALAASTVAGVVFNFRTTGRYVFAATSMRRLPLFTLCYGAMYFINLGLLTLVLKQVSNKVVAQAIVAMPVALISYMLLAYVVFRASPRSPTTRL